MSELSKSLQAWRRAVQIGLGVLAIVLAIYAIVYPGITLVTLVWILAIIFLIVGIEMVISGIFVAKQVKVGLNRIRYFSNYFGQHCSCLPCWNNSCTFLLPRIALLFDGIGRIIHGFGDRTQKGWSRGFSIGVGVLAVIFAILIMASPFFGAVLAGLIIGIILIIIGIQMITAGIAGRETSLRPPGLKK